MYSIGVDSGSTYTKGVLFDGKNIIKKKIGRASCRERV